MEDPTERAPIVVETIVPVDPATAYAAFVDLGRWWDPRLTPDAETFAGARVGAVGEPVALLHDGVAIDIGVVTQADPGVRFAQTFTLAQDPAHPTTLTIDFTAVEDGTRVTLSHGGWHAANIGTRGKFTEWPLLLARYADATRASD